MVYTSHREKEVEVDKNEALLNSLDRYHQYLVDNYEGGAERFFSPTGFLDSFQKSVDISVAKARQHVFAKGIDQAVAQLEPVVAQGDGVYDLTAEPGTGKTSVLPFRFPSKKVVVALPTPFDAFSAYTMATGDCRLVLKGLSLGNKNSNVAYMDSYMASRMLLSNFTSYDVLIVDECDSQRGVTSFLSEVKTKGKLLIRMSASHGKSESGPSNAFQITEVTNMPDVRQGVEPLAEFVKKNAKGRSLVLAPDAQTAIEIAALIPDSKLVCTRSDLRTIASAMLSQKSGRIYVADDVCARSINLNLDVEFDCQLVAEHGNLRPISKAELYQRKYRVGRSKPGWYYSPGLGTGDIRPSDVDIVRSNVMRAFSEVEQAGEDRLHIDRAHVDKLLTAQHEPFVERHALIVADRAIVSRSPSNSGSDQGFVSPPMSIRSGRSSKSKTDTLADTASAPSWLFAFSGAGTSNRKDMPQQKYVLKRDGKAVAMHVRRRSSESSSDGHAARASLVRKSHSGHSRDLLPLAESAPYAVTDRHVATAAGPTMALPASPPVMDLTQLTYDLDWPSLIRDRLLNGGDLPTLVPPDSWRHTSVGGLATDWFRRLDDIAVSDTTFSPSEFEVVCRAWNKLVAQAWIRRSPGLSNYSNADRLEFCARYFQSYFLLATAG